MNSTKLLLLVLGFAGALSSRAGFTDSQHEEAHSIFVSHSACKGKSGSLRLADLKVLGFTIGTSTIRDVQQHFHTTNLAKLTTDDEVEKGECVKNEQGAAAVFATGVMGSPDTLTAVYLAPASLVESAGLKCTLVKLPTTDFSSESGIRVEAASTQISNIVGLEIPTDGLFCAAYQVASSRGPLKHSKEELTKEELTDFTGAEGKAQSGKLEWVRLFGIVSD